MGWCGLLTIPEAHRSPPCSQVPAWMVAAAAAAAAAAAGALAWQGAGVIEGKWL